MSLKSSYKQNSLNFGHIFQFLVGLQRPKVIVEFGILEGFSLYNFVLAGAEMSVPPSITAYDIFDEFIGNHASPEIKEKFKEHPNVVIKKGDFFEVYKEIPDFSIDILHVDIANDGRVYEFAVNNYMRKLAPKGIMILEGGSKQRDEVAWMKKYEKVKITDFLKRSAELDFDYITMEAFPSVTIIRRKLEGTA